MAYGVFLVVLLASVFAINGQQDINCEHLQNELSALKKLVLNMNDALDKVQKKYDDLYEELREIRKGQQTTKPVTSKSDEYDNYPRGNQDKGETTHLKKRATAYTPTMHLSSLWNGTKATCGSKGDKGDIGLNGLKGAKGTSGLQGSKGDIGLKGNIGPKGDTGTQGVPGQKGNMGPIGITGPIGPKGTKGNTGTIGQTGNTGNQGVKGEKGQEGKPGTTSSRAKISFSVEKIIRNRRSQMQIKFNKVYWNDGNYYSRSTGKFTCRVPGVYLFTLNVIVDPLHATEFVITGSKQEWRHLALYESNSHQSGSVSAMLKLSLGEQVWIQRRNASSSAMTVCNFEGFLLYE